MLAPDYTGSTVRINDFAVGLLPVHIHKIHMGDALTKTGYNFGGVLYNTIKYPQDVKNCTTCHDGTGWCGERHCGMATTTRTYPAAKRAAPATTASTSRPEAATRWPISLPGRRRRASAISAVPRRTTRSVCLCHNAANIPVYHATTSTNNSTSTTTGAITVGVPYASTDEPADRCVQLQLQHQERFGQFRPRATRPSYSSIMNGGSPVTFNTYSATATDMLTGFKLTGPTIEIAYAVPQDGITAPADFNVERQLVGSEPLERKHGYADRAGRERLLHCGAQGEHDIQPDQGPKQRRDGYRIPRLRLLHADRGLQRS